jgi:hypothetical protein
MTTGWSVGWFGWLVMLQITVSRSLTPEQVDVWCSGRSSLLLAPAVVIMCNSSIQKICENNLQSFMVCPDELLC